MNKKLIAFISCCLLAPMGVQAQLSSNPDKFLGNITTDWPGSMNYDGFIYSDYWNQVTPENGTKWGTVQGSGRTSYYWSGADPAYNYARQKGFPFKFHCLVWGSQYPNWVKSLSATERYKAIVTWMDRVKVKYPNLEMIDVVNEAVDGHQADTYLMREALGGNGKTGYDWIIKAFEMAHERWPNAILIYNDYNTFRGSTDQFIALVRTLRDAGAPIDAYGCQSHEIGGMSQADFKTVMAKIQNALKIPMYITEYDIGDTNDGNQKWNFQQHIPVMWEADYCAGVTLWGWFYGHTWIESGNEKGISGLIKNMQERSALIWLREYMQTDKAKTAKSPFPGMKKEASVYVKPEAMLVNTGKEMTVDVTAKMRTKTVQSVALYVNNVLFQTLTEAPYTFTYTPATAKKYNLKAVVTTTDDTKYERLSAFTATNDYIPQEGDVLTIAKRFTSLSAIGSTPFAIINEADGKALYGSTDQNLNYDTFDRAFVETNTGYLFKKENSTVSGKYLLRLMTPQNAGYSIWGNPGYLNSQPTTGNCSFILGLNNQNGQDIQNGAVWEIQYVAGKGFSLKNVGTGKYLKTNDTAKYDDPTYFTFATLGYQPSGILVETYQTPASAVYNLRGMKVATLSQWDSLPRGLYVVGGKKVQKR